jgi:hypothetical protein
MRWHLEIFCVFELKLEVNNRIQLKVVYVNDFSIIMFNL